MPLKHYNQVQKGKFSNYSKKKKNALVGEDTSLF